MFSKLIIYLIKIFKSFDKSYSIKNLNKISTKTLKQKAARPPKTGFILDKAKNILGYNPHSFEESLVIIDKQLS